MAGHQAIAHSAEAFKERFSKNPQCWVVQPVESRSGGVLAVSKGLHELSDSERVVDKFSCVGSEALVRLAEEGSASMFCNWVPCFG